MKEEIKKIVGDAAKKHFAGIDLPGILVEAPKEKSHGDYSTNVAFFLAKQLKKNPNETALLLKEGLSKNKKIFKDVQVVGGFINFFINDNFFRENIKTVLKEKDSFGKNNSLKNKKVIIEYTDPNILKEFHIGHLMSNAIGESLSRIFQFQGANIKRACYQSDVGLGTAKAVWGKMQNPAMPWQEAYVLGTQKYEEDAKAKEEITVLNKQIFERTDKEVNKVYDEGKKWSLAHFESMYKKLGTKFDYYFFESQVAGFGKKLVENNIGKVFEKGDNGAIIFKGENVGLHTRVFINAEGLPTYEGKELGLAKVKYDKYKYDASVIITGNEVNEYFKVLMAAMGQIFPELEKKTKHIGHGMLRLPDGKMSSRTGKVITAESLIESVKKLVLQKTEGRQLPGIENERIAVGAIKYSILKQSLGSDIVYDFEKSISFEGDSGPYLQYSYARAKSILAKAKAEKISVSLKVPLPEITGLEKLMHAFPEMVEKAGKEYQPHVITLYLTELAREFNNYYANHKIADKADPHSPYKVALTQAFCAIMKNGLWLLGISAPEKM